MNFKKPDRNCMFTVPSGAVWPSVTFETDASGPHSWNWLIQWGSFQKSGTAQTPDNAWDAQDVVANYGGTLTLRVTAGTDSGSITVKIQGTNPSASEALAYLASKPGSDGFDKIVQHESKFRHFTAQGEPLKSFDNGYGMCQLTNPVPAFEQVWNWKHNIDAGLALFATKRAAAIQYLSQNGRAYTEDQVRYEAVCRWNGGSYHVWDSHLSRWVRNPNVLCDSGTGNIGWDMTDPANKGKSETELHQRDSGSYSRRPQDAHWKYFGVCYADAILR
jgi:hypothetical protein